MTESTERNRSILATLKQQSRLLPLKEASALTVLLKGVVSPGFIINVDISLPRHSALC